MISIWFMVFCTKIGKEIECLFPLSGKSGRKKGVRMKVSAFLGCINKICHVYETFNIAWGSGMDVLVGRMSAE
jgi:hypothetical protein